MDHIGASKAMVNIFIKPIKKLNKPYLLLSLCYVMGQFLNVFIPSAAGLGALLMTIMFPLLMSAGVSRLSAVALVATTACLDLGPASGNSNLAAKTSGIDPMTYFINYQVPVAIPIIIVIAVLHYIVQKHADKKLVAEGKEIAEEEKPGEETENVPAIYAILPALPLIMLFIFSRFVISTIKVNVITAMIIGFVIAMIFETIRMKWNFRKVFDSVTVLFKSMGGSFANVITLLIAGQVFARGLEACGAIKAMIHACENIGFGPMPMTVIMVIFIALTSLVTGSGVAPFFAFAALAPTIAKSFGTSTVLMAMPMQLTAGIARSFAPFCAVVILCCGMGGKVSNFAVVKRTAIPMIGGIITLLIADFVLFAH
jgi:DcuC family C4-dicarboxylate transporter